MPRPRAPIPESLAGSPFTVAQALAGTVGRRRLYADDLHRPTAGVRSVRPVESVRQRAAAMALVLPEGAVFSHQTAATLLELPLPPGLAGEPIHVSTPGTGPVLRRAGVAGHRGADRKRRVTAFGLPVASPADTWVDLAATSTLDQLVQVGDAILARNADLLLALGAVLLSRKGSRGLLRAKAALALVRPGCRSPMETLARLQMLRGGLPTPCLNRDVTDALGQWVACVDFCWPEQRVIVEYDGEVHADPRQRRRDAQRRRQLSVLGWTVIVITSDDVLSRRGAWLEELRTILG